MNPSAFIIAVFIAVGMCVLPAASDAGSIPTHTWNFTVSLGDKPIGTHTFVLVTHESDSKLVSTAHFDARFVLVYHYHYDHEAVEQWQGDALTSLNATTDDDGKKSVVHVQLIDHRLEAVGSSSPLSGCEMSFAYWNPAILKQTRLLNAQTGKCESVSFSDLGDQSIPVRGQTVAAHRYALRNAQLSMTLWYSSSGDWLALDAQTPQNKTLHYRLE